VTQLAQAADGFHPAEDFLEACLLDILPVILSAPVAFAPRSILRALEVGLGAGPRTRQPDQFVAPFTLDFEFATVSLDRTLFWTDADLETKLFQISPVLQRLSRP
jgi:hypothetical protein